MEYFFNERLKILQIIDFEQVHEFRNYWGKNLAGFASVYLRRCNKESKSNDEIDKELYAELVKLDTRLGTRASDQLYECLSHTTRSDIIKDIDKVKSFLRKKNLKLFKIIDFDKVNKNKRVKKANNIGYAHFYYRRYKESKSEDDIDEEVYSKFVKLDTRLGISPSEQLFMSVFSTLDLEMIEVCFQLRMTAI